MFLSWRSIYITIIVCLPVSIALEPSSPSHALAFEHSKMQELVKTQGYPLEEHFVTTVDGYVLGVYRIPCGRTQTPLSNGWECRTPLGPPVLLQHGLLDSSGTWVVNFPKQSLGFILADAG